MALGSLREAVLKSDVAAIETAVENCEKLGLAEEEKVEETRNSILPTLVAKKELESACGRRDRAAIESCMDGILADPSISDGLFVELNKARILLDLLSEQQRLQDEHRRRAQAIYLNGRALSEMRRYHKPPQLMHRIVQAALLLLGDSEDLTDDWKYCQRLCNPQGPNALSRRLMQFQPEAVPEETVARAKQILSERDRDRTQRDLDPEKMETIGAGAGLAFYVWAKAAIERAETTRKTVKQPQQVQNKGQAKGHPPISTETHVETANRRRQKELLQQTDASGKTVEMVAPPTDRRGMRDYRPIGDRRWELGDARAPRANLHKNH